LQHAIVSLRKVRELSEELPVGGILPRNINFRNLAGCLRLNIVFVGGNAADGIDARAKARAIHSGPPGVALSQAYFHCSAVDRPGIAIAHFLAQKKTAASKNRRCLKLSDTVA
jgi:hypothetical protein